MAPARGKNTNAALYALIALLFLGGVGWLIFSGLSENSTYFLDVAEARAQDSSKLNNIRLFGTVQPASIREQEEGLGVRFTLQDQHSPEQTMFVDYKGVVPDTFKDGAEVIVEGSVLSDGSFKARVLMTKCPSKYQKENRTRA